MNMLLACYCCATYENNSIFNDNRSINKDDNIHKCKALYITLHTHILRLDYIEIHNAMFGNHRTICMIYNYRFGRTNRLSFIIEKFCFKNR